MALEISPALHEIIVSVSRKAVDDRLTEVTVTRQDFAEVKAALRDLVVAQARTERRVGQLDAAIEKLTTAQARTEQRVEELAAAQARTEQRVEELAAAQARTEQRVDQLDATMKELAAAQARTEQRMDELAQAQARTEQRMDELAQAQANTEKALQRLADTQAAMRDVQGDLVGQVLEINYRDKAYAYLGSLLRRVQVVPLQDLEANLEQHLSDQELNDLIPLDVLVKGQPRRQPDAPEVWLAIEVSGVVDRRDVERAMQRAQLLRQAGYPAIPAVAGKRITDGGKAAVRAGPVLLLQNGRAQFWEEALGDALARRGQDQA